MELFTENKEIFSQHFELMIETLKFSQHIQSATFKFERIFTEAKRISLDASTPENLVRFKNSLKNVEDLYLVHQKEHHEMYKVLMPLVQRQRSAISNHLREMAQR